MFAYCGNNPVCFYDPDGYYSHVYDDKTDDEALEGIVDAGGGGGGYGNVGFAYAYNPIDARYTYYIDLSQAASSSSFNGGIASNGYTICTTYSPVITNNETVVYRWHCTDAKKLRPSNKDAANNSPMSFSTQYKPGSAKTTIGQINSTGVLIAIQDNSNHVSVYPIGVTIGEWRNAGVGSVWTTALLSVVEFVQ